MIPDTLAERMSGCWRHQLPQVQKAAQGGRREQLTGVVRGTHFSASAVQLKGQVGKAGDRDWQFDQRKMMVNFSENLFENLFENLSYSRRHAKS